MLNPAAPSAHRITSKSGSRSMWLIAGAALAALTVQHEARAAAWAQVASMAEARQSHTTLRLLDGRMIAIAGEAKPASSGALPVASVEAYDPAADAWTSLAPAPFGGGAGYYQNELLADGRVLRASFEGAEVFDPAAGSWARNL